MQFDSLQANETTLPWKSAHGQRHVMLCYRNAEGQEGRCPSGRNLPGPALTLCSWKLGPEWWG